MRPGLTCLWAIEGRDAIEFDTWMKLDLQYIDTWSLWLDFKDYFSDDSQGGGRTGRELARFSHHVARNGGLAAGLGFNLTQR